MCSFTVTGLLLTDVTRIQLSKATTRKPRERTMLSLKVFCKSIRSHNPTLQDHKTQGLRMSAKSNLCAASMSKEPMSGTKASRPGKNAFRPG